MKKKYCSLKLPALLLQPVVENAIKFGFYDTTGEVLIIIEATAENNYLKMTVKIHLILKLLSHLKERALVYPLFREDYFFYLQGMIYCKQKEIKPILLQLF